MSYTPGPWKVGAECKPMYAWRGQVVAKHPTDGGDFILASCNQNYPEMAIDNDHLIAAAPELLEALKAFRESLYFERNAESVKRLTLAAIAKAEGRHD